MMKLESHETFTQVTLSELQKINTKILAAVILKKSLLQGEWEKDETVK